MFKLFHFIKGKLETKGKRDFMVLTVGIMLKILKFNQTVYICDYYYR